MGIFVGGITDVSATEVWLIVVVTSAVVCAVVGFAVVGLDVGISVVGTSKVSVSEVWLKLVVTSALVCMVIEFGVVVWNVAIFVVSDVGASEVGIAVGNSALVCTIVGLAVVG